MNQKKHLMPEKTKLSIDISEHVKIKTVLKGEETSIPLELISWSGGKAKENGINVVIGHRGEIGVFISEEHLRKMLKEIDDHESNGTGK